MSRGPPRLFVFGGDEALQWIIQNFGFFQGLIGAIFGSGVMWGILRTSIAYLKEQVGELKIQVCDMQRDIQSCREKPAAYVTEQECDRLQDRCIQRVCAKLESIETLLKEYHQNSIVKGERVATLMVSMASLEKRVEQLANPHYEKNSG
jgi:hypothetical protein